MIRFLMSFAIACGALLTNANQASADATDKAIDRLFDVMNMEQTQDAAIVAIVDSQAAQNPAIQKVKPEFLGFLRKVISWKALEPKMRDIYRANFTEAEIKDLVAFYQSSTGRKSLVVLPRIVADSMTIGQDLIKDKLPEFLDSIKDKLADEAIDQRSPKKSLKK